MMATFFSSMVMMIVMTIVMTIVMMMVMTIVMMIVVTIVVTFFLICPYLYFLNFLSISDTIPSASSNTFSAASSPNSSFSAAAIAAADFFIATSAFSISFNLVFFLFSLLLSRIR